MKFPDLYQFPPFFTRQPAQETREKQIREWMSWVVSYCEQAGIFGFTLDEACMRSELFHNTRIKRTLSPEFALEICRSLETQGRARVLESERAPARVLVYRKPITELEDELDELLQGYRNAQPHTLGEVAEEIPSSSSFSGCPYDYLYEVLCSLARRLGGPLKLVKNETLPLLGVIYSL